MKTGTIGKRVRIFGRVQGVSFRVSAEREAKRLGLSGFVRNEADGSVTVEVHGDRNDVEAFLEWARKGPDRSVVERTVVEEISSDGREGGFHIMIG